MAESKIEKAATALRKEQSERNWRTFSGALKGSGITYYKIKFANEGKLNKMQDLTKSVAELYDAKYKKVTEIPIFMNQGKKIRGATIYLTGLQVSNKVD